MSFGPTEVAGTIVIATTVGKVVFDFFYSGPQYKRDINNKKDIVTSLRKRNKRDFWGSIVTLAIISLATIYSIGESSMNDKPVSESKFTSLEKRVKKIEDIIAPPGGGPTVIDRISLLESKGNELIAREELKKIIQELRAEIEIMKRARLQIQLPSSK